MNKHYLVTAFKSSFRGVLKSSLVFVAIMIAFIIINIVIAGIAANNMASAKTTISYFEFAAMVMVFVLGICCIREDARLLIQHGVGRTTTFVTEILIALATALLLTIAGEIILGLTQLATQNIGNIEVPLAYQIYSQQYGIASFSDYLLSAALMIPTYLMVFLLGMLISMIFYRLPKPWKIVVAIGLPVLCFIVIPFVGSYASGDWLITAIVYPLRLLVKFCAAGPGNCVVAALAFSVIFGICSWLLFRKAPIK